MEERSFIQKYVCPPPCLSSAYLYFYPPQTLEHNPNGRFVTVCGDGEYIVYTALAWRNKSFGQALEFVWSADSNQFAVRETASKIKVFKDFKVGRGKGLGCLQRLRASMEVISTTILTTFFTFYPAPSQEKTTLKIDFNAEGIYGGVLIGVRSADFIVFYDWEGTIVRRIDVAVKTVHWAEVRHWAEGPG